MSKTYRHQQIQDVYAARRHAPTPALVTEGKARIDQGIRRLPGCADGSPHRYRDIGRRQLDQHAVPATTNGTRDGMKHPRPCDTVRDPVHIGPLPTRPWHVASDTDGVEMAA